MCGFVAGLALVEELDKRLLVQLRDGRKIVGVLRCLSSSTPGCVSRDKASLCEVSALLMHGYWKWKWFPHNLKAASIDKIRYPDISNQL